MFPTAFAPHQKAIGTPIPRDIATFVARIQPVGSQPKDQGQQKSSKTSSSKTHKKSQEWTMFVYVLDIGF